ncbi:hypothetical protein SAMN04490203_1795 [Pseudomonas taetrolens]|uniref:Uncharacterized protein n=1 Tax=Pseudomonas taetrolens TaxID=47884 RepID=A0A1H4PRD5_PSETA|nr:hypothetical protein SAMN04490203_1795 [Pseudomonas taetrolens]SQF85950.1 Uncharacterised protein [Pseudomonas taetrolens]VEH49027.1 Uncharacterised protein [Pseudomonas taetrolens]
MNLLLLWGLRLVLKFLEYEVGSPAFEFSGKGTVLRGHLTPR